MRSEIETLRSALLSQREWIKHWQKDKDCNLAPTNGSLMSALVAIDAALEKSEAKREAA
ncbi:hypothetical protein [Rhizobium favelukesii]|uniref:hypothetical protein n=1 Tax=Rhizobium favelukesii TaxID=348824 RepID=UPI002160834C|nr:hypothetical protein [Rhizobium favelukesii]MCS0459499.1 hypothetical protein [Rhizobium favelukesii]